MLRPWKTPLFNPWKQNVRASAVTRRFGYQGRKGKGTKMEASLEASKSEYQKRPARSSSIWHNVFRKSERNSVVFSWRSFICARKGYLVADVYCWPAASPKLIHAPKGADNRQKEWSFDHAQFEVMAGLAVASPITDLGNASQPLRVQFYPVKGDKGWS